MTKRNDDFENELQKAADEDIAAMEADDIQPPYGEMPETGDLDDPRIASMTRNQRVNDYTEFSNGMAVAEMQGIPANESPMKYDAYLMGTPIQADQDNMMGQAMVMFNDLKPGWPGERYMVITDYATGAQIKVRLPKV